MIQSPSTANVGSPLGCAAACADPSNEPQTEPRPTVAQMIDPWWILCTRPRFERNVADQLDRLGIDYFLPTETKWYSRRDRPGERERREVVMFPSYVFANTPDGHAAAQARHVAGVLPVPDQHRLARELAIFEQTIAANVTTSPFPDLVVGREARVKSGPLQGMRGVLIIRNDRRQVFVLVVTTLGAARELEIDPAVLELAD